MSAISSPQTLKETEGLLEAVELHASSVRSLEEVNMSLKRATIRQIMDKVDQKIPPGDPRLEIRKAVIASVEYYYSEIQRWAASESKE
jgi:hypothetical protein